MPLFIFQTKLIIQINQSNILKLLHLCKNCLSSVNTKIEINNEGKNRKAKMLC